MRKELLNTQIEALSVEHGAQIVEFYKMNGFDTGDSKGSILGDFYGIETEGYFCAYPTETTRKTITLEQAKELVSTKDFSKMDLEEWLIETEKLGLSEDELIKHLLKSETCPFNLFTKILESQGKKYGECDYLDLAKILFKKWNTKNDLYTEITVYKLQDGTICESKEDAENKSKEIKIHKELHEFHTLPFADFVIENLETIKQIINQ